MICNLHMDSASMHPMSSWPYNFIIFIRGEGVFRVPSPFHPQAAQLMPFIGTGILTEQIEGLEELVWLNKPNCCPLTCVVAAPHLHLGIIDSEHPAPGDTHICRHLHVDNVISAGSGDVKIPFSITGIETCLGRQGQRVKPLTGESRPTVGKDKGLLSSTMPQCPAEEWTART